MSSKLLYIDSDAALCVKAKEFLGKNNFYDIKTASDGLEGFSIYKLFTPDIVVLDSVLPRKDGIELCRMIRESSDKPIIIVSARTDVFDKIIALELGADDYIEKPFDLRELSARIRAVLRRYTAHSTQAVNDTVKYDKFEINRNKYEFKLNGELIELPPKEFELLYFLSTNYNRVFSRNQLLDKVWGFDYLGDSRTVDVHIKRLREKLADASDKWELRTVWGVGYKFETYI